MSDMFFADALLFGIGCIITNGRRARGRELIILSTKVSGRRGYSTNRVPDAKINGGQRGLIDNVL